MDPIGLPGYEQGDSDCLEDAIEQFINMTANIFDPRKKTEVAYY